MNFWQKTKRFLEPALENKWDFIFLAGISVLFGSSTGYITIYITKIFTEFFSQGQDIGFGKAIIIAMSLFLITAIIGFIIRDYSWVYPQFGMKKSLEKKYIQKFILGDNIAIEKIGTGRMISILIEGVEKWSIMVNESLNNLFRWLLLCGISFSLIGQLNIYYGLGFLVLFLLICLNTVIFSNWGLIWRKKRKNIYVELGRMSTKMIMSKFEILQNNKFLEEISQIHFLEDKALKLSKKTVLANVLTWQISRFLMIVFTLGLCVLLYYKMKSGAPNIEIVANSGILLGLMSTFSSYFNILIEYYINFTKEFVHIEKLWDTFDNLTPIKNFDKGKSFSYEKGNFQIKNLNFSYNENAEVLKDFSLTIAGGKRTALVGRSGSGKTTLMKLLSGYMRPTSGKLLIDDQNVTDIRLDSYYPHIGYLTQEPSVFDGTIEENLLYGIKEEQVKEQVQGRIIKNKKGKNSPFVGGGEQKEGNMVVSEKIKQAISLAECDFIYELEHGIKTEIGERGVRLSGGQKQRLAIAKIFLKNPEIILLDEPTAALDSYSEQKVAKAFQHLFVGRTVIVIAHRLQTVKSADDIIVLEKGKIVERGTHEELLKLGKKYAGMVDLQSGIVREENEEQEKEQGRNKKTLNKK